MSSLQPAGFGPARGRRNSMVESTNIPLERSRPVPRKTFVLCFDGTGNKFHGDDSDSNILKIYRMLDRDDGSQFHYYQPGIGTYISSNSLSHTSIPARFNSWYQKAKDSAIGTSFDHHVMGGYRFLMRNYSPGDDIYFFGFSRGAYVARFLAEMLDHIGLLDGGQEEMTRFAWKTFALWQQRKDETEEDKRKKKAMFEFMKAFRETFSRPVRRIRFLGLFDTVNSVPRFESAWMSRSKFPYTARSSAKMIRHAVSIDERRAKFRQDLISQDKTTRVHHHFPHRRRPHTVSGEKQGRLELPESTESPATGRPKMDRYRRPSQGIPTIALIGTGESISPRASLLVEDREQADTSARSTDDGSNRDIAPMDANRSQVSLDLSIRPNDDDVDSDGDTEQDIEEVWFPGCHADIGGGWSLADGEQHPLSHGPLVWMVRQAQKAGLRLDPDKMAELKCSDSHAVGAHGPNSQSISQLSDENARPGSLAHILHDAATRGKLHDCLEFNNGLPRNSVLSWRIMEYLPFRRMDLQPDGSWKSISWPLPKGEVRDMPEDAKVHNSALRRMEVDENYRPGNLIIGGGGRGERRAPKHLGIGDWVVINEEGDAVGEVLVRNKVHRHLPM